MSEKHILKQIIGETFEDTNFEFHSRGNTLIQTAYPRPIDFVGANSDLNYCLLCLRVFIETQYL